jgi:hypothetical protein
MTMRHKSTTKIHKQHLNVPEIALNVKTHVLIIEDARNTGKSSEKEVLSTQTKEKWKACNHPFVKSSLINWM